ncbi:hypothetical protein HIM_06270 [Hirsutella minnesotensis 3608]|uniref:Amidohydrolase-related domain-containing protein n=1 Tax=Hirsutella minnesotensis 3608 TaxID=1043627 RepID=A0A0F8A4W0_9HYPO|nr:hypothetical protein HIM_06270 [Hirsutella minnesotensis 3608]
MDEKNARVSTLGTHRISLPSRMPQHGNLRRRRRGVRFLVLLCVLFIVAAQWKQVWNGTSGGTKLSRQRLHEDFATCKKLHTKPRDPVGRGRSKSARYVEGGPPTLIRNATIWIGDPAEGTSPVDARAGKGWAWTRGDVFLQYGLIQKVDTFIQQGSLPKDTLIYDAAGRPVTSGIIDMHSHAGVYSLPRLSGNMDINERSENLTPWARSIDGFQLLDPQIQVIKSGGVTASLILPGSSNNIGGEAYLLKLAVGKSNGRNETSVEDLLADPERNWRYMKMACGENAKNTYGQVKKRPMSRLGESYDFRHAFEQATWLVRKQDDWCTEARKAGVENMATYLPQEIARESLAAAIRGHVFVNTHCYTIRDLEAMVDHSNEFKFAIRSFHHAHQSYLAPEVLRRTWGGRPPSSALFADNMYYKAEAYVGSEFAGKYLYDQGLTPVYVSDNPVLNAQHVVFEAAKGYRYGLPYHAALASVTSAPAEELGMGNRLGKVKPGFDADVVVWDSDPLSVGSTPTQVWIDGVAQFKDPFELLKPVRDPLTPRRSLGDIVEEPTEVTDAFFSGVTKVLLRGSEALEVEFQGQRYNVVVRNGTITCIGACKSDFAAAEAAGMRIHALKTGYLTDSFTGVAGSLGLNEIDAEQSTDNGINPTSFTRAIDGLQLGGKKLRVGGNYGVTRAISAPKFNRAKTHHGTSVGFVTSFETAFEQDAVFSADVAVHYTLDVNVRSIESYSAAFGSLRAKLMDAASLTVKASNPYSETAFLRQVIEGDKVLALTINSADGIAIALRIKKEIESSLRGHRRLRFAIIGGAESHLVAKELAEASVGVILLPLQPAPETWDARRAWSGAPLTNGTAADALEEAGVRVGIGLAEDWWVRDLGLQAGVAYRNGNGKFTEKSALDLVSANIHKILGIDGLEELNSSKHFIVSEGSPLDIDSRIVAVGTGTRRLSLFTRVSR